MMARQKAISAAACWVLILTILLPIPCRSADIDLQSLLKSGASLGSLSDLSDRELSLQLAEVVSGDLLTGQNSEEVRFRLHAYLVRRLRGQYRNIPEPLWRHLTGGDLTALFNHPEEQRREKEPGFLQRLFSGAVTAVPEKGHPLPRYEEEPDDYFPAASYRLDGDKVQLDGGTMVICGRQVEIPPLRYLPPRPGEDLAAMAGSILSARAGKPVALGAPIAEGGMRLVYAFPEAPSLLLKIYDPARIDRIRKEGNIKVPTAVLLAYFLQRDLTVMDILAALRQKYLARELEPPFELAALEKDQALLERGIVVQEKISGLSVWKDLPAQLSRSYLELLDRFFLFHEYFNRPVSSFVRSRYDIYLFVQPADNEKNVRVGIDYGRNYSNFFLKKDPPRLILYDW